MIKPVTPEVKELSKISREIHKISGKYSTDELDKAFENQNLTPSKYIAHMQVLNPLLYKRTILDDLETHRPLLGVIGRMALEWAFPLSAQIYIDNEQMRRIEGEDCNYLANYLIDKLIAEQCTPVERESTISKHHAKSVVFDFLLWLSRQFIILDMYGVLGTWKEQHSSYIKSFHKEYEELTKPNTRKDEI